MYLDELLKTKWKIDANNEEGLLFCNMPEINNEIYLHRLYNKIDMSFYDKFEQAYQIYLLPELKEFYKYYNGCRLFHSSINIFGINVGKSAPMNLVLNNINLHAKLSANKIDDKEIVYIGSVGDYAMYYKQCEINNPTIYLSNHGELKVHKQFSSLQGLLTYYITALSYEYNEKGYRKHPIEEKWCQKYPLEKNSFNGDIDWDTDEKKTENEENLCK